MKILSQNPKDNDDNIIPILITKNKHKIKNDKRKSYI